MTTSVRRVMDIVGTRRGLRVAVGLLWLLDGVLQAQPFMFSNGFSAAVLTPAADGQPQPVKWLVSAAAAAVSADPVALNAMFAAIQIGLGVALVSGREPRVAVAASLFWSGGVWVFGEGLAGLASGHASVITGAPGAAVLYAVLSAAAWPRSRDVVRPSSWLGPVWIVTWLGAGLLQLLPVQRSGAAVGAAIGDAPSAVRAVARPLADAAERGGVATVTITVSVLAIVAAAPILSRRLGTALYVMGAVIGAAVWLLGQDLGALTGGQSTDPNSGPLLILLAVAASAASRTRANQVSGRPGLATRQPLEQPGLICVPVPRSQPAR